MLIVKKYVKQNLLFECKKHNYFKGIDENEKLIIELKLIKY